MLVEEEPSFKKNMHHGAEEEDDHDNDDDDECLGGWGREKEASAFVVADETESVTAEPSPAGPASAAAADHPAAGQIAATVATAGALLECGHEPEAGAAQGEEKLPVAESQLEMVFKEEASKDEAVRMLTVDSTVRACVRACVFQAKHHL